MDQFFHRFLKTMGVGALGLVLGSCQNLFVPPLEIIGYGPAEPRVQWVDPVLVWVEFSREVPRNSAEQGLILSENGVRMDCRFSWQGNRVYVQPDRGLALGNRYDLRVAGSVEDLGGVDLGTDFYFTFYTRPDDTRPVVTINGPAPTTPVLNLFEPVTFTFSRPVDRGSFYESLSVSPPVRSKVLWGPGDLSCQLVPLEALGTQTLYSIRVDAGLKDCHGNRLGTEVRSWFRTGTPGPRPRIVEIVKISRVHQTDPWIPDLSFQLGTGLTRGMEAFWGLEITFDRPVLRNSLDQRISVEPSWNFLIPPSEEWVTKVSLEPRERLVYGTIYTLKVAPGISDAEGLTTIQDEWYPFRVDGAGSLPPRLENLVYRPKSGTPTVVTRDHSGDFQVLAAGDFSGEVVVDLEFRVAQGAEIDLGALASRFSATSTELRSSYKILSLAGPEIRADGLQIVRAVLLVKWGGAGVVVFRLGAGVSDTLGNKTVQDQTWLVRG